MIKYKRIYLDYFDYCEQDFIPCENYGKQSVDIHHLEPKGMGGSKSKDYIENLIGLCRTCHNKAHSNKSFNEGLKIKHLKFMNNGKL